MRLWCAWDKHAAAAEKTQDSSERRQAAEACVSRAMDMVMASSTQPSFPWSDLSMSSAAERVRACRLRRRARASSVRLRGPQ